MLKPPAYLRKQAQCQKKCLESSRDVLTAEKKGFGFAESRYSQKAQSAMEYLMTYGWSILVIAVVIGVLFELGVFNSGGNALPNACIPQSGYMCSNPQLSSTGNLLITFGQAYGSVITVTGTGCSGSTAQPSTFSSTDLSFASGAENSLVFSCPTTSNAMGTEFHGTLWIEYTKNNVPGIISQVAEITAKATTTNSFAGSGSGSLQTSYYVPITLSNQQSSGTAANFQQMVFFNPSLSQYSQYEASNLSNIEFTSGAPAGQAGSTPMYAWLESGASTAATNTVAWVNLGSSTLGAAGSGSNTLTIYMNFMPNNAPVTSHYTGYAPQLWCASGCFQTSYAQYDDGASVFSIYNNFIGNTLSSSWTYSLLSNPSGATGSYSVSNSLTVYNSNGIDLWQNDYMITLIYYNTPITGNYIIQTLLNSLSAADTWTKAGILSQSSITDTSTSNGEAYMTATGGQGYSFQTQACNGDIAGCSYMAGGSITYPTVLDLQFDGNNYGGYTGSTLEQLTSGGMGGSVSQPIGTTSNQYFSIFITSHASPGTSYGTFQYILVRSYPPNGVMPSVSFGSVS